MRTVVPAFGRRLWRGLAVDVLVPATIVAEASEGREPGPRRNG